MALIYLLVATVALATVLDANPIQLAKRQDQISKKQIEQCQVDGHQNPHDRFEVLFDDAQDTLFIIVNKRDKTTTSEEFTAKCRPMQVPQLLSIKVTVSSDTGDLVDLTINKNPVDIRNRIETNERSVYSVRLNVSQTDDRHDNADGDLATQQPMSFVEQYLIKQDKLNNTIWIYEELKMNTTLAYLTVDQYASMRVVLTSRGTIEFTNTEMSFQLVKVLNGANANVYALRVNKRIDREQIDYYDLTISVNANHEIRLRVCLIDVNDNRPRFIDANTTSHLHENRMYANFVQVRAVDDDIGRNGQVTYELVNASSPFYINKFNGFLSLESQLDRELCGFYLLNVRVCDMGDKRLCNQTTLTVNVIDENDNGPVFDKTRSYLFKIRQFKPSNTFVADVKPVDPDLDPKTAYKFEPSNMSDLFWIDTRTGRLYSKVVFNQTCLVEFQVVANDAERSDSPGDSVTVRVNVTALDDNDPFIEHKTANKTMITLDLAVLKGTESVDRIGLTELPKATGTYDFLFIKRTGMKFLSRIGGNNSALANLNTTADSYQNNLTAIFGISSCGLVSLTRTSPSRLNMGLYNLSIRLQSVDDSHQEPMYRNLRIFVYNSSVKPLSLDEINDLDETVDNWFAKNLREYWLLDYESKYANGLYAIDHDYYENLTTFNSLYDNFLVLNQLTESFLINNNMIIVLICLFLFIAIGLVAIITYKHYKVTLTVDDPNGDAKHDPINNKLVSPVKSPGTDIEVSCSSHLSRRPSKGRANFDFDSNFYCPFKSPLAAKAAQSPRRSHRTRPTSTYFRPPQRPQSNRLAAIPTSRYLIFSVCLFKINISKPAIPTGFY